MAQFTHSLCEEVIRTQGKCGLTRNEMVQLANLALRVLKPAIAPQSESESSVLTFTEWAEGYDKTYGFDSGDARRVAEVAWNAALATRSAERGVPS